MLDDVRFTDNDYLCKKQDVPQLCAGEEQTDIASPSRDTLSPYLAFSY
jgi:hypothetical protein